MSSQKPIRVGFVGLSATGWASIALAPPLLSNPSYKLVAVSTSSPASASASAEKYSTQLGHPVKAYHGSTAQISADPDVDLVVVSVRAPSHKDALLPAIEAGKDVFIEWPAGRNLEETTELADKAREKGVRSIVGLQGLFSPVANKVKELIESGKIGKVLSTAIISLAPRDFGAWGPRIADGNAYVVDESNGATPLDIAIGHQLSILTHILGDFASVSTTSAILYPTASTVDASGNFVRTVSVTAADHVAFSGMLQSGAVASVIWRAGQKVTPGRKRFLWEIDGEEGSIRLEGDNAFVNVIEPKLFVNGEPVEVPDNGAYVGNTRDAWEDFAKGKDGNTVYATLDDAVKNRRLLDAINRSGKEGKRISL